MLELAFFYEETALGKVTLLVVFEPRRYKIKVRLGKSFMMQ